VSANGRKTTAVAKQPQGLSKEQLRAWLERYEQARAPKPVVLEQLYDTDDPRKMALVTETPPRLVPTIVELKVLQAALDPNRKKPLVEIYIEELDRRMISYGRKGRMELLGALQALSEGSGMGGDGGTSV
jgi:hypothetical protein